MLVFRKVLASLHFLDSNNHFLQLINDHPTRGEVFHPEIHHLFKGSHGTMFQGYTVCWKHPGDSDSGCKKTSMFVVMFCQGVRCG